MYNQLNYVLFNDIECQVNGNSYKDYVYKLKNQIEIQKIGSIIEIGWHYEYELQPIPITEKWLEKLGFIKNGNHLDFNGFSFIVKSKGLQLWRPKPNYQIKFIHELQNWYHALYNEYLIIN